MEATKENNLSKNLSVKQMTLIALMTAVTCILGPLSIPLPFSPVPISFTNFAIYLTVYILGMKKATVSYLLYLLLGIAGLPVFSGFSAGIAKLAGPTGGYLIGFIFMALITGFFVEKFPKKIIMSIIGMILGLLVCYIFGSAWLAVQAKISFWQACMLGMVPYLPGDAIKIAVALAIGPQIRKAVAAVMN